MAFLPVRPSPPKAKTNNLVVIIIAVVLLLLVLGLIYTCRSRKEAAQGNGSRPNIVAAQALQIPALKPGEQLVNHTAYALVYNEPYEQSSWVAWVLRGNAAGAQHFDRTNQFLTDPLVSTGTADDADYAASGYDRGHLASAEDMSWSEETMRESFYYSNMSPQVPAFNRGVWKRLEELVRFWSSAYDSVYVVAGPVLKPGLPRIGHDGVAVPEYYYKVVLEYNSKGVRGIGFVLRNQASAATLKSFAVSIDSVEQLTGIDFFPQLPDNVEAKVEANLDVNDWYWTRKQVRQ